MEKKRNSNIELLKILAIFLIILSHSIPYWWEVKAKIGLININQATTNYKELVIILFRYFGQVGNYIFVVASSYFLLEKSQINKKKILYLIMDTWSISLITLASFFLAKAELSMNQIIKSLMPLTFSNNWFILTYLVFYLIHPILNTYIDKLKKEELLKINIFIFIFFYIWQFIKQSMYINLLGFIAIYFIVAYLKKYNVSFMNNREKNILMIFFSCLLLGISIIILNYLGLHLNKFNKKMVYMCNIINPFIAVISICTFNLFVSKKKKLSKICNFASSLSLLIYLLHDNILVREIIKSKYYEMIYIKFGYDNIISIVILTSLLVWGISMFLASIYVVTIKKINIALTNKLYDFYNMKLSTSINKYKSKR